MRSIVLAALLCAAPALAAEPMPRLAGNTAIHDPSIIATESGWASFATGVEGASDGGMPRTKTSPDGIMWSETGAIPGGLPDWIPAELGYTPRNLWAPSIRLVGDTAHLYYSASSFGRNDSAIGLMTNSSFNVEHPAEGWTDQGMVLRSRSTDNFNAIDPFRFDASDGRAWLAFGSFWDGIRMVELDRETGLRLDDQPPLALASRSGGAIEAPAILEREGRFYLFVSFDSCCKGLASTYRIMVGRSEQVEGPYLDRDGKPMLEGGGSELLATTGRYRGPGGQETFIASGEPWLGFHYYDRDQGGLPKLQIGKLGWSEDGWPELGSLPD